MRFRKHASMKSGVVCSRTKISRRVTSREPSRAGFSGAHVRTPLWPDRRLTVWDDAGHAGHRRAVMRLPLCAIMCWIAPCGSLTGKNSTGYCCRIVAFQQRRHVVDECIVSIISPKPIATPGSVSIRCSAASKNQLHAGCTEPSKRRERRDSPSNQRADVSIRRLTCKRPKPAISHPTVAPISQPIAA